MGEEEAQRSARSASSASSSLANNAPRVGVTRKIAGGFGPDYVAPQSIHFYGQAIDIVRDANTHIRQILNTEVCMDFVFVAEKSLEIRQYKPSDIATKKVQGLYVSKAGAVPVKIDRLTQSGADSTTSGSVLTETIDNSGAYPI